MSVEVTIVCNGCGAVGGGSMTSAKDVRAQLRGDGWSVNRPGGEDLCDTCKPQRRATGSSATDWDGEARAAGCAGRASRWPEFNALADLCPCGRRKNSQGKVCCRMCRESYGSHSSLCNKRNGK